MKQEIKQVWKDIKEFDAQIRTIEKVKDDDEESGFYWVVEVGLFESLGELSGDILTENFFKEPTEKEIKERVLYHLEDLRDNLKGGFTTAREDKQIKVLKRLLK